MSIAENYFIQENGSDSETNSEDDGSDYYQPVSAIDDTDNENEDEQQQQQQQQPIQNSDSRPNSHNNGFVLTEPRVDSLDLNDENNDNEEEEEEREREEREREAAMRTAFREDENRRNAPLGQENAVRIMEAMRQISLAGFEPDWANRVPEDRWVHQLTTLRQNPTTSSTTSSTPN